MEERYIAAVDLGTSKIGVAVAKVNGNDVQVIWYGEEPSEGIRYGYIYNPNRVLEPFKRILDKAGEELGIRITQAAVGLPRYYVHEVCAPMSIERIGLDSSITKEEIESLKEMAIGSYPLDNEAKEVHFGAIAQSFDIDDMHQATKEDIIGTLSEKLCANFKVFIGSRISYNYIDKLFNDAGVAIAKRYFTPETTAKIVLTTEEMETGVALVDMGAGVTSVTVFSRGILRHYASIPFGGASITEDIRLECGFTGKLSESIKLTWGNCMSDKLANHSEKVIKIDYQGSIPDKELPIRYLSEIIQARETEIIEAIMYEIQKSGYADELRSGIVITGGACEMTNSQNLIKEKSGYNVRIGYPLNMFSSNGCMDARNAGATTCMGMIMAVKNDISISCAGDGVRKDTQIEADTNQTDETAYSGTLFPHEPDNTVHTPKGPKKTGHSTRNPLWEKINNTVGSLFDGIDNE